MAKDKVWVDCPVCGEEKSMEFRKNQVFNASNEDFGKIKVEGLSGYFCKACSDGFFDISSKNKIKFAISEAKAKALSEIVKAVEVETIARLAKELHTSKTYAIQAMREGKVSSVFVAGEMRPFRKSIEEAKKMYLAKKKKKLISH
ncbi:hypothetical protein EHQ23_19365 [Leptospira bourretii]|uniref:YgiT-type zinc finger protein n=1 Tax=Leptospira bourretii TaxID=2484962 RepID=A0A4R9IQQ2_9LEPT|nr:MULTISPECIES: hypothetical protein [Leptospira]TGK79217.1 hypothetical protein EHQ23_19365 [Leptospira bourretii]TGK94326.1 hypothetical protein EHQ26_03050 [Leptospira bourretii]TGL16819.1 hypothetical protein EHQ42_10845 [Leptospira levettii]TGL38852.1 hypothetical protein EHQ45_04590 [Leptospira bourretii]